MKTRLFSILVILAIGLAGFTQPAQAQAYITSFTTSITYQNVGTAATTQLQILFYALPTSITPITITQPSLAAGAGTAVYIGGLGAITAGFQGTAVMQADQPLLATLVQVPDETYGVKNRPISNGFFAGAPTSLIATVLKGSSDTNTIFSVQNVDSVAININIKFYNTSAFMVHEYNTTTPIQPGAGKYWDTGVGSDPLPAGFSGSAVVIATRVGGGDGLIVSSVMELEITKRGAKAFEGVSQGAKTVYMPSALCNYLSAGKIQNTAYAIQNADMVNSTTVTVTYTDLAGVNTYTQSKIIGAGAKAPFFTCEAGMPYSTYPGWVGSAVVTSSDTDVVAVGKVYGSGASTGFVGTAAGGGSAKIALPYVRWANNAAYALGAPNTLSQRVYIAIQNIGSSPITGNVTVDYVDCHGIIVGTHTITQDIAAGAKVTSFPNSVVLEPNEFGRCGTGYGGSALITAPPGSELTALGRVQTQDVAHGETVAEDYNSINVP